MFYSLISILGHIVGAKQTLLNSFHFIHSGLFAFKALITAVKFSSSLLLSNLSFHIPRCIFHVLSSFNSTLHFLISFIVDHNSGETVPAFGEGISHLGHSILATFAKFLIILGVVTNTSNCIFQASISFTNSSLPAISAHIFFASSTLSGETKAATLMFLPFQ
jgi:hypothetical protein